VWVGAAPYLLFIPDTNGDDVPDGISMEAKPQPGVAFPKDVPPGAEVLLDGWGREDTHETLNTFIWGPDGWLYGCHGVFTHSRVGKPGTPNEQRKRINAGIWRYHPTRHEFEVFAEGTSNPWGVDFNDYGHAFCTACVIPHLYHIIQGGRYQRQAGQHFNPYTFDDIKTIADHVHYLGPNPHGGNNKSDSAGGGHAHAGAMIYLGGKWPEKYRGQIFMNNIHGQRINMDILEPRGSGYVGKHGPDFLLTNDRWSQIINLRYGPDGDVYMIDWYDKNACHHNDVAGHDRTNGRIFKVIYGQPEKVEVDLQKLSDLELAKLVEHKNDWYVRHSRRILQERASQRAVQVVTRKLPNASRGDAALPEFVSKEAEEYLIKTFKVHQDDSRRLRALLALHVCRIGSAIDDLDLPTYADKSPYIRAWALQLIKDDLDKEGRTSERQVTRNSADLHPVERLYAASLTQRLGAPAFAFGLKSPFAHGDDANDHNLPLMYWYALEPSIDKRPREALDMALNGKIPLLVTFTVRKIASDRKPESIELLIDAFQFAKRDEQTLAILGGLLDAMKGRRDVPPPENWTAAYDQLRSSRSAEIIAKANALAAAFGDETILAAFRQTLVDSQASIPAREQALAALLRHRDKKLPPILRQLLTDNAVRAAALRGLAAFDDSETPTAILAMYSQLPVTEKRDAIATLASRKHYANELLIAMAKKRIPPGDITADLARQIKNLGDEQITAKLAEVWGNVGDSSADNKAEIARWTSILTTKADQQLDPAQGRSVFAKTCQQCHTLFGEGGKVGPDLTGSNRANLEYVLSNILDPSAVMAKEYQPSVVTLADGRVITGIIKEQDKNTVTVQMPNESLTIGREDIDEITSTPVSMMPADLLKQHSEAEVRALIAYLASPRQVPLTEAVQEAGGR
jgi:putative membrane-bound dehydrogenase-like protein